VAKEGNVSYRLKNPDERLICKVKIDGCYITDGERCDYLIIDCDELDARFVELKGSDFFKAIDQINATIEQMSGEIQRCEKVSARIVLSKVNVPDLRNNAKVRQFQKMLRAQGGDLCYRSKVLEETLI